MLVFHSHCQMGNQMFIYACARSLARLKKTSYCLSELTHLRFFELGTEDKQNKLKYLLFKLSNRLGICKYTFHHLQDNRNDYSEQLHQEKGPNHWYYGYFQGEKYFFNNQADIKKVFRIKEHFQNQYKKAKATLVGGKKIMAVHIRLKDYKTFGPDYLNGPDLSLPFTYYHQLIAKINPDDKYAVVFMSDDMEMVKKEFSYVKNAIFSSQNAIVDFQFIQDAEIAVVAQSSFGWWAAWLNTHPDKKVYIPEYFLGFKVHREFPVNIIPAEWIRVPVPGF